MLTRSFGSKGERFAAGLQIAAVGRFECSKKLAERVGFEPTVRITAQRLSSSKTLMLACAAQ